MDGRAAIAPLEEGTVQVYRASLDPSGAPLSWFEPLLAPEEREWVRRLRFEHDRRRYTVGRLWLRWLLSVHVGALPGEIRFRSGAHGKPAIAAPDDVGGLRFSASYSGDVALFALTRNIEVGIDVERVRSDVDVEQIAASFFAPAEREALRRLPPELRVAAFFACWTRKEAYVKALGVGLSLPLDTFDVAIGLDGRTVPEHWSISGPAGDWSMRDLEVEAGYAAALAIEGHPERIPHVAAPLGGALAAMLGGAG